MAHLFSSSALAREPAALWEVLYRSWLHLPREFHFLFSNFKVPGIEDFLDDVGSVAELVVDHVRCSIANLIDGELLACVRFDVGELGIVINSRNMEWCFPAREVVVELQLGRIRCFVLVDGLSDVR